MKEARVKCLCPQYRVSDLGLTLLQDQVVYLTEAQVQSSKELRLAFRAGALSVRWQERCRVKKEDRGPAPPYLRPRVRRHRNVATKPQEPKEMDAKQVQEVAAKAAAEAVRLSERKARKEAEKVALVAEQRSVQRAAAAAKSAAEEAVRLVLATQGPTLAAEIQKAVDPSQAGGLTQEALEGAVQKVLGKMLASGQTLTPQAGEPPRSDDGPEEPVFIPEELTTSAPAKKLSTTTTESSSSGGLDAAAAALKMMQGGKKGRRRKKT